MNKYKICVYAICKNEEQFVDRWMDAVSEADMVVVTDTGSTDNTVEKLRARGAVVYEEQIAPWRFDTARNRAMDHIPTDMDICVSNDVDEIFEKGWRQKLENAWNVGHTLARYLFTWSYKSDGTPDKQFVMAKIHSRNGYRWVHPVHEILSYDEPGREKAVWVDGLVLNHYPDMSKPRSQYLPLLELSAKENPQDDRTAFWLGREYMYYDKYDECIQTLKNHLEMPSAVWDEERSASAKCIAHSYYAKGDLQNARAWSYRAIAECPCVREPYLYMVKLGYQQENWPLVFLMVNEALKITAKTGSYLMEPEAWGCAFYDYGAMACYFLGMYQKACDFAASACNMEPDNMRLKGNLALFQSKLQEQEAE